MSHTEDTFIIYDYQIDKITSKKKLQSSYSVFEAQRNEFD